VKNSVSAAPFSGLPDGIFFHTKNPKIWYILDGLWMGN
jgi:hypothetical protein